jgi:predicted nucleic acid-binding protein
MMEQVWEWAARPKFAYRKIFDMRLAATLRAHQVREFATRNIKDFEDVGFVRVWNPLQDH